jgi:hypothetical protein
MAESRGNISGMFNEESTPFLAASQAMTSAGKHQLTTIRKVMLPALNCRFCWVAIASWMTIKECSTCYELVFEVISWQFLVTQTIPWQL